MKNSYIAKVEAFIRPFLDKNGYYLIKSEFVNEDSCWYLRLYIDLAENEAGTKGGIDISDCAKVSRTLSKWLDKEDFISETYTLEVCSRGFLRKG